jgi:hypothetical protein
MLPNVAALIKNTWKMLPNLNTKKMLLRLRPIAAANTQRNILAADESILSITKAKIKDITSGKNSATHLRGLAQIYCARSGDSPIQALTIPLITKAIDILLNTLRR